MTEEQFQYILPKKIQKGEQKRNKTHKYLERSNVKITTTETWRKPIIFSSMSHEFALSSLRSLLRRRVEQEKRNSESTSDHRSLPASKVDFINERKTQDPPSKKKVVNCVGDKAKDEKSVVTLQKKREQWAKILIHISLSLGTVPNGLSFI